jgi:hypothetical protein
MYAILNCEFECDLNLSVIVYACVCVRACIAWVRACVCTVCVVSFIKIIYQYVCDVKL